MLRNSGDFVTGRMVVGLLLGVTTDKGNDCTAVTAVRCFLCNAEADGSRAMLWCAGSLRQECSQLAVSSLQARSQVAYSDWWLHAMAFRPRGTSRLPMAGFH